MKGSTSLTARFRYSDLAHAAQWLTARGLPPTSINSIPARVMREIFGDAPILAADHAQEIIRGEITGERPGTPTVGYMPDGTPMLRPTFDHADPDNEDE